MTDLATRVRDVALQLPGATERAVESGAEFAVEDKPFARVTGEAVSVLADDGWHDAAAAGDLDPALLDDMVAHGWELAAPAGLLEAGGR